MSKYHFGPSRCLAVSEQHFFERKILSVKMNYLWMFWSILGLKLIEYKSKMLFVINGMSRNIVVLVGVKWRLNITPTKAKYRSCKNKLFLDFLAHTPFKA